MLLHPELTSLCNLVVLFTCNMVLQNCQVLSSALLEAIKLLFFVQDLGEFPIREFVCISYDWYSVDFMEFLSIT